MGASLPFREGATFFKGKKTVSVLYQCLGLMANRYHKPFGKALSDRNNILLYCSRVGKLNETTRTTLVGSF